MTSAFVPFHQHLLQSNPSSPPTPPLPSPPLYSHPISTKLPSLFEHGTRCKRDTFIFDKNDVVLPHERRPMLPNALPSYGFSLPPLQNVISSPPPLMLIDHALSSPPEETEELGSPSASRKGSIASILNSAPELRQMEPEPPSASIKRGRPRCAEEPGSPVSISKRRKCQEPSPTRRRDDETRASKGLRHFSKQVCDKVAEKGVTTYNEVADELALDIRASTDTDKRSFDQKNIRRRVYDALNVLMAMDIIAKDKKQIKWLGIPSYYRELANNEEQYQQDQQQETDAEVERYSQLRKLVDEEERRQEQLLSSLCRTRGSIHEKLTRHLQLCNLIWRNQRNQNSAQKKVSLPFFVVASNNDVQVDVASDGFSAEITQPSRAAADQQVYEDVDILQCLELNRLSRDQLAAWIPDQAWQSLLSIRPASSCDDAIYIQPFSEMVPAASS